MGRFVPISYTTITAEKAPSVVTGAKSYYDGKQCWQYKVVFDRPGSYTWTAPSNAICARTVLVGGGGKPKCLTVPGDPSGCNSAAGAGGAYSEKVHAITPGSTFTLVVGRQEQDTTLACNSVSVHTAGGAAGCIPGAASGGDWTSRGGCVGYTCNNCGGSYSHYCGSCKCISLTNCCGYCIVYQYEPTGSEGSPCCGMSLAGGASAGSFLALCGGSGWGICGSGGGGGTGGTVGGGAGIGGFLDTGCVWHYNCCYCICAGGFSAYGEGMNWCTNYPGSAQGGGGTGRTTTGTCRSFGSQACDYGVWKGGDGGIGGLDQAEGNAWTFEWGWKAFCTYPFGGMCCWENWREKAQCCGIAKHEWWDIQDMKGSGSPGTVGSRTNFMGCWGGFMGTRPRNAGEGAGTGGVVSVCCNPSMHGTMIANQEGINWLKLCSLGTSGQCDQAWLMQDALFPMFLTCAGTLGGSGGVNWCRYTSKAGKGGGGGQSKCQYLCVCWGGVYDCCNQVAATPLAFPPCLLDQLVSNAGTGMAIIYYREA